MMGENVLRPGQDIVVTKWVGLQGTLLLARDQKAELEKALPRELIRRAEGFAEYLGVKPDTDIALQNGACAIHCAGAGGIFGALWEMASDGSVGLEAELKRIPVRQETIEVCEVFRINPYQLMSGGTLLIGTDHGTRLVWEMERAGIHAAVVGIATAGNDRVVRNGQEKRYLEPPKTDELYRVKRL